MKNKIISLVLVFSIIFSFTMPIISANPVDDTTQNKVITCSGCTWKERVMYIIGGFILSCLTGFAVHKVSQPKPLKKEENQTRKSRKIVQITGEYFLSPSANENAIYEAMAIVSLLKGDNLAVIKEKFEVSQREMLTLQKDLENAKELLRDTKLEYKLQAKATAIKMMVADERVSLGALSTLLDETEELLKEAEPKYNENMNFNR